MNLYIGIIFGLISMLGWGIADFFGAISSRKIGEHKTLFWTQSLGFILLLIFYLFFQQPFNLREFSLIFIMMGFFEVVGYLSFYKGLSIGLVSIVSPIASSWAIIVIISGLIFLKERLETIQILAIIFIIIGVFLSSTNLKNFFQVGKRKIVEGVKEGLIAMFSWGIVASLIAYTSRTVGWLMPIFLMKFFVIVFLSSSMGLTQKSFKFSIKTNIILPMIIIGFLDVVAFVSYSFGVTSAASGIVASLAAAFPLITIILARIFFKEKLVPNQIIGIAGVLSGIILLTIK